MLEIAAAAVGIAAVDVELLQVVPGAEDRPSGGDHDRAHALVAGNGVEFCGDGVQQFLRQAVARLRTIERQHRDAGRVFAQQGRRRLHGGKS